MYCVPLMNNVKLNRILNKKNQINVVNSYNKNKELL